MSHPDLRDRAVLVTGGAGVIGRELLEHLSAGGAQIMCCDLKRAPDWLPPSVTYVEGDANELAAERVADFAPEYCFHLAATFERTIETPEFWGENFHHNVLLSHRLATIARNLPSMKRFVFASSYLVYDPAFYLFEEPASAPSSLPESTPLRPRNLCGSAKLMHEEELEFLERHTGTPFTSVSARIFRVYGRGSKDVVSRWVRASMRDHEAPLQAFRVEGIFDYVYAGDVAEGLLRLATSGISGSVNIGTGTGRRVSDLLQILSERFPGTTWSEEPADISFEAHQADITRLQEITGWRPQTSLEQGVDILADHELAS